jgi:hypothetical protein
MARVDLESVFQAGPRSTRNLPFIQHLFFGLRGPVPEVGRHVGRVVVLVVAAPRTLMSIRIVWPLSRTTSVMSPFETGKNAREAVIAGSACSSFVLYNQAESAQRVNPGRVLWLFPYPFGG